MRLNTHQATTIRQLVQQVFGAGSQVYLFGSRTDDTLKGGDIDLYIEPSDPGALFQKKLRLGSLLQTALGEQKIDLVIAHDPQRLIEQQARTTGILL